MPRDGETHNPGAARALPGPVALLLRWLPFAIVTIVGCAILWPVPAGVMPLSADHTVHLTRAWLLGQNLMDGHVTGWSSLWFFGFPAGELYPPLGDLGVCLVRALSLGALDWSRCYALVFTLVFVGQGWALLRAGRALGLGPLPGLIAALLALADVGAYREGGWIYTVMYGVWPQALATTLATWAFAELGLAARAAGLIERSKGTASDADPFGRAARKHLALAAVASAGALLAHPMSMLMLAGGAILWVLVIGMPAPGPRHPRLVRAGLHATVALGAGLALAAWWLLPMLAHRGWMASYGWLHVPLELMGRQVWEHGRWASSMPTIVGHAALAGLAFAALAGNRFHRFVGAFALTQWALASVDVFWRLRLDWLSEGFTHLQYQRFLIAAKPWLLLLAGSVIGALATAAVRGLRFRRPERLPAKGTRLAALGLAALATIAGLWLAVTLGTQSRATAQKHGVGDVQVERVPGDPEFAAHYDEFLSWARERHDEHATAGAPPYRIAFKTHRNLHWFMDSPVTTGTPVYKLGFTPGANFVHKPEAGNAELYARAGVRYVVTTAARTRVPGAQEVARFGTIRVLERDITRDGPLAELAHLEGPGELERLDGVPDAGLVRLEVRGTGGAAAEVRAPLTPRVADDPTWLVMHVAGYPRWRLSQDGQPLEWIEVPARAAKRGQTLQTATQADRRGGLLRGGKAHGDDGSEPILMAAPVGDGTVELRYHRWLAVDITGALLTALGALTLLALVVHPQPPSGGRLPAAVRAPARLLARLDGAALRVLRPAVIGVAALAAVIALGLRWSGGHTAHQHLLSNRLPAQPQGSVAIRPGPLKTDMLIRPALVVDRRHPDPAELVIPELAVTGETLEGWYAIDDDDAKMRRRGSHTLRIELRLPGGAWTTVHDKPVRHRPGIVPLSLPVGELAGDVVNLRVQVRSTGDAPPRLGFDFTLPGGGR